MVLSSDKVSGLRRPLLLLKLQTLNPDNSTASNLIEMDAKELNKLLKSLKAAQKVKCICLNRFLLLLNPYFLQVTNI